MSYEEDSRKAKRAGAIITDYETFLYADKEESMQIFLGYSAMAGFGIMMGTLIPSKVLWSSVFSNVMEYCFFVALVFIYLERAYKKKIENHRIEQALKNVRRK